ncbi:hypothetical protein NZD89_10305 [Alicyclobacillus fastidiosus]|uniref:MFS transporter n=1 Tax=Alicyclobacillus fastidiosus TaxID=392011 RepID=A0ABY6ZLL2_9BACL|nr:hypothetical protein [Alicyclobacillus fastidiosus]WAH43737.1 hypothetical protein NZD89_10305 [Alicyclobacillus fastidiosus]GMA59950.1 hypothetical protein GCM10025859_03900 [Alicyclobacillus fastidiosus]
MANPQVGLVEPAQNIAIRRTTIRWSHITTTLAVMWIIGVIDKIGVAVIATNKPFLQDMHLAGHNGLIGSLTSTPQPPGLRASCGRCGRMMRRKRVEMAH